MQLSFDKPVCPADFVNAIKMGLSKFDEFRRSDIGLTAKPVGYVVEISPDYNLGIKAFDSKNYELALTWLKPLAEQGHGKAQSYLGYMHQHAYGVARDYREAARWYLLAADQGDTYSQVSLGEIYEKGLGVVRDDSRAAQWYAKAADLGYQQAQLYLATLYRDGRGVARDYKQAEKWYATAKPRLGDECDANWRSANRLPRLLGPFRARRAVRLRAPVEAGPGLEARV